MLADLIEADARSTEVLADMIAVTSRDGTPDARFEAALAYMRKMANLRMHSPQAFGLSRNDDTRDDVAKKPGARKSLLKAMDGVRLGEVVHGVDMVTLRLRKAKTKGFEDWLIATLPELHRQWEEGPDTPLPGDDEAP